MAVAMAIVIRKAGPDQRQLVAAGIQVPALAAFTQPARAGSTGWQAVGIECLFFSQLSTAFRPADHREPAHSKLMEPLAHFESREIEIGICPRPWPLVFRPIETSPSQPVLPGEVQAITYEHPALFGRVDHKKPTQ